MKPMKVLDLASSLHRALYNVVAHISAMILDSFRSRCKNDDHNRPLADLSPSHQAQLEKDIEKELLEISRQCFRLMGRVAVVSIFAMVMTSFFLTDPEAAYPKYFQAAIFGVAFFCCQKGPRLGKRELDNALSVVHVLLIIRVLSARNVMFFLLTSSIRYIVRMAICLHVQSWLVLAWNLAHSAAALYAYVWGPLRLMETQSLDCLALFISVELLMSAICVVLQRSLRAVITARIEARLRYDALSSQYDVANNLLSVTCDAVVLLGADLGIMGETQRFAAMVMFQNATSLVGKKFLNYIGEADRVRFHTFLQADMSLTSAPLRATQARLFHTDLRDVNGEQFPVGIIHVSVRAENGEAHHVLGIREMESCSRQIPPSSSSGKDLKMEYDDIEPSYCKSISTSSVSRSSANVAPTGIKSISVELIDGHEDLSMKSVVICFDDEAPPLPRLIDWFTPASKVNFEALTGANASTCHCELAICPPHGFPFGGLRMLDCIAEYVAKSDSSGKCIAVTFRRCTKLGKRDQMKERTRCCSTQYTSPFSGNEFSKGIESGTSVSGPKGDRREKSVEESNYIRLRVRNHERLTVHIQIKKTTRLRKLLDTCRVHFNQSHSARFMVRGVLIGPEDTVETLDLKEGDLIQLF